MTRWVPDRHAASCRVNYVPDASNATSIRVMKTERSRCPRRLRLSDGGARRNGDERPKQVGTPSNIAAAGFVGGRLLSRR